MQIADSFSNTFLLLALRLPGARPEGMILVQDADSQLSPDFIERATGHLGADRRLGSVGGVFRGARGGGFVGHLQRNEYARYARDVKRLHGKCLVVTGTAALFRVRTLVDVIDGRLDGTLPPGNGRGGVYDTSVLTEDNGLSFALLTLNYRIKIAGRLHARHRNHAHVARALGTAGWTRVTRTSKSAGPPSA